MRWAIVLVLVVAVAVSATTDPTVEIKMFDVNGNPTTFASRPGIFFQICLVQPSAFTVTGLKTESTHLLLRSAPDGKLLKYADYDDLEPYLTPVTHTDKCVHMGIAIGNIWMRYFGLDANTDPATVSFLLHAPLQLALGAPHVGAAQDTVTATPGIAFGCSVGCHTHDTATTADAVVGWTLLALFFVLVMVCIWWAISADANAEMLKPVQAQRVELVIRDERKT
jgi:hypothetical protein